MLKTALPSVLNFLESKNGFAAHIVYIFVSWDQGCLFPPSFVRSNTEQILIWEEHSPMLTVLSLVAFVLFCFCLKRDLVVNHILSFTSSRIAL